MQFKQKAIFLDMDGTILNHQNKVSIHTKEIIDDLRNQGIFVFLATGRAFEEVESVVPKGFKVDGMVTSNGMAGFVGHDEVFKHSLPRPLVDTIVEKARQNKVYYELFPYNSPRVTLKHDYHYVVNEIRDPKPEHVGINEWLSRKEAIKGKIAWADRIQGDGFSKFYFFSRTIDHINSWKEELEKIKEEIDFTTSSSSDFNVEVMVANVNKATGIKQMLKHFNLSVDETMAIGDSDNDIQMLKFVRYPVVMKNATDRIKEMATEVTEFTCDEDGVYHYLKSKFEL
ncbi:Cof-type HAD-IIB family hydrolase [Neobacillus sp. LXY-4]|uniref:Cof-type HAD-IIB family hydrolase n=1 Tax=Neobacillus sp. LXY-4 TaxID=3379826 RepID=UPI003EE21E1F